MRNKYLIIILIALFTFSLSAESLQAANEVTFDANTDIVLTSPSETLVALSGGTVDSMTVNGSAGTIAMTMSSGGNITIRSNGRKLLTEDATAGEIKIQYSCDDDYSQIIATGIGATASSFTITVSSSDCSSGGSTGTTGGSSGTTTTSSGSSGTSGGSTSGGTTTTTTDTTTTTETTTDTTTDTTTTETAQTTTTATPGVPATDANGKVTLGQMVSDATKIASGDVSEIIAAMGVARNTASEEGYSKGIVATITKGAQVSSAVKTAITNFVTYGTPGTKVLGAGERAGVVNSYFSAFGKMPGTTDEWNDVVKIANGRWPTSRSQAKEDKAKTSFKTIYLREPKMTQPNDNAAVTVMAYGLRPADRNLNSEKAAIKSFKAIFGFNPSSASNWDAVRAIAYSGATR